MLHATPCHATRRQETRHHATQCKQEASDTRVAAFHWLYCCQGEGWYRSWRRRRSGSWIRRSRGRSGGRGGTARGPRPARSTPRRRGWSSTLPRQTPVEKPHRHLSIAAGCVHRVTPQCCSAQSVLQVVLLAPRGTGPSVPLSLQSFLRLLKET
ncbi:hypothetical protein COCON_G00099630 [Conger conger]|uniref:Uncharacterized protein n=1 Tax=Conger conger TaxID=82655 RepID=A0A9Q1DMK4_CONCO|nr:hypothetical protein COCON_G00099630 [Conger conger]